MCWSTGFPGCQDDFTDGNYDSAWTNSRCILLAANVPYSIGYCNPNDTSNIPLHANNTIYTHNGTAVYQCGDAQLSLAEWQKLGLDRGTQEAVTPDVQQVVAWASEVLFLKSGYGVERDAEAVEEAAAGVHGVGRGRGPSAAYE